MARKRKYLNRHTLKALAQAQLSNEEISAALRVSWSTIARRYEQAIKVWRHDGVASLRRRLYMIAMRDEPIIVMEKGKAIEVGTKPGAGAVAATIFSLKNYAGMTDGEKNKELGDTGVPLPREFRTDSQSSKPN